MAAKPKRDYPECDRLGTKKDGLKWDWKWVQEEGDWFRGSWGGWAIAEGVKTIEAAGERVVTLDCTHWKGEDKYYCVARVLLDGVRICRQKNFDELGYDSRIDAQRAAEELVAKLGQELLRVAE